MTDRSDQKLSADQRNKRSIIKITNYDVDDSEKSANRPDVDFSRTPRKKSETSHFIPVNLVVPDRNQARILLPDEIGVDFYYRNISCFDAMRLWLVIGDKDQDQKIVLQPIMDLAKSINSLGQIEPAAGMYTIDKNGSKVFNLEVGERRFWAIVYNAIINNTPEDEVTITAKSYNEFSIERQIAENEKSQNLSPVSKVREVARLVLYYLEIEPDETAIYGVYEFSRNILKQRVPSEIWERASEHTGLSQKTMQNITRYLRLDDNILNRAHVYNLSFNTLENILQTDVDKRANYLNDIIGKITSQDDATQEENISGTDHNKHEQIAATENNNGANTKAIIAHRQAKKIRTMFVVSFNRYNRDVGLSMEDLAKHLVTELREDEIEVAHKRIKELAEHLNKIISR